jgi:phosphoribosylformylglycinamidine (FGAM) synthase PurS component
VTATVAVGLKIPDNAAYTALTALRRLGVAVERVECSEIHRFEVDGDIGALVARITSDETVFNPNKHRLTVLDDDEPRTGEVWIEPLRSAGRGPAATAWRLFDANGEPVSQSTLAAAAERLLCNPAIDRAVARGETTGRDNPSASE